MKNFLLLLLILISFNILNAKDATKKIIDEEISDITNSNKMVKSATQKLKEDNFPIDTAGYFHFFWSNTTQDKDYDLSNSNPRGESEGSIDFIYKNALSDSANYLLDFNVFKEFDNSIRMRGTLELEDQSVGKIQFSGYRRIQDDLFVNTYWIKKGSGGAFDRSINLSLNTNNNRNPAINENIITDYDTAMLHTAGKDSASAAIYKNFLDQKLVLGISYTPRTYHGDIKNQFTNYKNIITLGAIYQTQINDQLKFKFSTLGEHGVPASQPTNLHDGLSLADLNAINFGTMIEYNQFSIAGSVGLWGKSNHLKNVMINKADTVPTKDSYYFDIATSYNINEKAGISLSYFRSMSAQNYLYSKDELTATTNPNLTQAGQSEFQNISLAVDYKLFKDFVVPYAEINKFTVKDNSGLSESDKRKDNIGWVFVLGAKSKF